MMNEEQNASGLSCISSFDKETSDGKKFLM